MALSVLGLAACASVNAPPEIAAPLPTTWQNSAGPGSTHRLPDLTNWWRSYRNPELERLIELALVNSPTLEQALRRVEAARAQARSERTRFLPQLDANGSTRYERRLVGGENALNQTGDILGQGANTTAGIFLSGFDASWEIDLFGRVRNAVTSADYATQAALEDVEVARVTLIAELVRTYIELRGAERRSTIVTNDINARQRLVQQVKNQKVAGLSGDFDVQRTVVASEAAKARLPTAQFAISAARQRLATLAGQPSPGRPSIHGTNKAPILLPPRSTLPGDLLRTRPEIRQAERIVAQRAADVGVATAELYPRLTLNGTLTIAADILPKAQSGGQLVSLAGGPALSVPLLDWGQRRAIVDAREAQLKEAIASYKLAVLTGVEEVEVSLASIRYQNRRVQRLKIAVAAAVKALETADTLYKQGLTGLVERLTAETELRSAELDLAEAQEAAGVSVVRLYKALGAPAIEPGTAPNKS